MTFDNLNVVARAPGQQVVKRIAGGHDIQVGRDHRFALKLCVGTHRAAADNDVVDTLISQQPQQVDEVV